MFKHHRGLGPATSSGIHYTTNHGTNWSQDLPEINMYAVRIFGDVNNALCGGVWCWWEIIEEFKKYDYTLNQLTSFAASSIDGKVELNWRTASETNNRIFEIENKSLLMISLLLVF